MHMDSTIAVHIAMIKFSEVTYNSAAQMVTIRAGLIWNDVYAGLDLYEVNVVGGCQCCWTHSRWKCVNRHRGCLFLRICDISGVSVVDKPVWLDDCRCYCV